MNLLIPKIIECGQFHIFDELLAKLIELKNTGFIPDISGVLNNSNLALLWQSCVKNESVSRLFVIIEWINEQKQTRSQHNVRHNDEQRLHENDTDFNRFVEKLDQSDIMKALVLAVNANNNQLFVEIMTLCAHRIDGRLGDTIIYCYCIENQLLHSVLSEDATFSLSSVVDVNSIISLNKLEYFRQIVDSYCIVNTHVDQSDSCKPLAMRLGVNAWNTVCEWLLHSIAHFESAQYDEITCIVNEMLQYFVSIECFQSLCKHNIGDATRWIELAAKLINSDSNTVRTCFRRQCERSDHDDEVLLRMNGVVAALQMMAAMRRFDILWRAINNLPAGLMRRCCRSIAECIVCRDVNVLRLNEHGMFERIDYEQDIVEIVEDTFEVIQLLDELHSTGRIVNEGWIEGERNFRVSLEEMLQNLDHKEVKLRNVTSLKERVNGLHQRNEKYFANAHRQQSDRDMKWLNALSDFAFRDE
eukprot:CAMPEP_0197080138 /NCGR_PEP_ID=MMETSP1384-20130603/213976_1 /TAXON_ID=29189 /ORGANISM="Ammonia sp." /LENGTH=471 /DNA_ID=CAMNT_0042519019 /DNA_START=27 /DNA_END=1442 /DNA_ORIENTATION=-